MSQRKIRKIADKLTKRVVIRLDNQDWPIVIDHNLLIECEDLTGLNSLTGEINILRPSAKLLRAMLYLALQRAGAPYTIEEIGALINPQNIVVLQKGLLEAWAVSMPSAEEVSEDRRPTQAAS